jgi:hypothetical protein
MTESKVQNQLYEQFIRPKRHVLAVPNCKPLYPSGESDVVSMTKAGLVHEFEIKLTHADFLREFSTKEFKHEVLEEQKCPDSKFIPNYYWFVMRESIPDDAEKDVVIPEYAGLITVGEELTERKKAPRLHSDKATERVRQYLERGLVRRFWE